MKTLFKNIKQLVQVRRKPISFVAGKDMSHLPVIENAWLLIDNGYIVDFGEMDNCPDNDTDEVIDVTGKLILPAWCDSHTHIVYAGNREGEFVDKINGLTYEQIAKRGGGILNSAQQLQEISEDKLYQQSKMRLAEVIQMGTGAIEIKSGYGLTKEAEIKMLRVIKYLKADYPVVVKASFLGAHALPKEYANNKEGYLQMLIDEVLPVIAREKLADYVDVFCEKGYFSVKDAGLLLAAGQQYGLRGKIHVNQFNIIGGVQAAVKYNALSVDHLEVISEEDIKSLKNSQTMPVALPGCSFFLGIAYTPARRIIEAGLPLALASDYNPGSTPSGNMNLVLSLASIKMKMTPEEAINAATINGAYAMGVDNELGSITKGKKANLIITKAVDSYVSLVYSYGANLIDNVYFR